MSTCSPSVVVLRISSSPCSACGNSNGRSPRRHTTNPRNLRDYYSLKSPSVWSWLWPCDRHVWWERICWKRTSEVVTVVPQDWRTWSLDRLRFLFSSTPALTQTTWRSIVICVSLCTLCRCTSGRTDSCSCCSSCSSSMTSLHTGL
jgi:hypothetical protein